MQGSMSYFSLYDRYIISSLNLVKQSLTTAIPFGIDTGVEALQDKAIYASSFGGANSLFISLSLCILLISSGYISSLTNTTVLFFTPPVVASNLLYLTSFI